MLRRWNYLVSIYNKMKKKNFADFVFGGTLMIFMAFAFWCLSSFLGFRNITAMIIFSGMALIGITFILGYFTGGYKKTFINKMVENEIVLYDILVDFLDSELFFDEKVEIGNKYMVRYNQPILIILDKIVWAYTYVKKEENPIFPAYVPDIANSNHYLKIALMDEEKHFYYFQPKDDESVLKFMEIMEERVPHVIYGYSDKISHMVNNDFEKMLSMVQKRKAIDENNEQNEED